MFVTSVAPDETDDNGFDSTVIFIIAVIPCGLLMILIMVALIVMLIKALTYDK